MATTNLDAADLKAVSYRGLINEDVMQRIWDISKIPVPLTDRIGTGTAKNPYKEWTTDELAVPNTGNKQVDGADTNTINNTKTGARVGNHCQISVKVVQVSTRAQESDTIGRSNELAYQVMRPGQQELRRDVEAIMLTNQASVPVDGNTTPGQSGGLGAWLTTSTDRGATGADGGFSNGIVAAPALGAKRALSETKVRDIVQSVYQEGGDPSVLMSVPSVIRKFSEYLFTSSARVATLTSDQGKSREKAAALGSVNVFVTDFETLELGSITACSRPTRRRRHRGRCVHHRPAVSGAGVPARRPCRASREDRPRRQAPDGCRLDADRQYREGPRGHRGHRPDGRCSRLTVKKQAGASVPVISTGE